MDKNRKTPRKPENRKSRSSLRKKSFGKFCHDLKTPLTVIKLHLDLLQMPKNKKIKPAELSKFIKTTNREISRVVKMLSAKERHK